MAWVGLRWRLSSASKSVRLIGAWLPLMIAPWLSLDGGHVVRRSCLLGFLRFGSRHLCGNIKIKTSLRCGARGKQSPSRHAYLPGLSCLETLLHRARMWPVDQL